MNRSYQQSKNITHLLNTVRRSVLAAALVMFVMYFYLMISTTLYVAEGKTLQNEIRDTRSAIALLEVEYLAESQFINEEYALSLGFQDPENLFFVERNTTSHVALQDK